MSALVLRSIAAVTMLLDHIGFCFGIFPLRVIGRLAFPLYVFLMVNGFRHTKNCTKYAIRFAILALVSQIPFQLMRFAGVSQYLLREPMMLLKPFNVMLTLLLGLIVIWLGEILRKGKWTKYLCLLPAVAVFACYFFGYISSDYGGKGILLAVVFWLFDGNKLLTSLGLFVSMYYDILLNNVLRLLRARPIVMPGSWEMAQLAILLTLPLIFLYNGRSGMPRRAKTRRMVRNAFYAFYPVHMLLLWASTELLIRVL